MEPTQSGLFPKDEDNHFIFLVQATKIQSVTQYRKSIMVSNQEPYLSDKSPYIGIEIDMKKRYLCSFKNFNSTF